jgi:peptidoglycan/xylan/chitin deacetylase (PgdA/CDA1 family)
VKKELITGAGAVREKVARFPKMPASRALSRAVSEAFRAAGLDRASIWYYPGAYRSVFNFRYDLDEDIGDALEKIASVASGYKDCSTMFCCCSSFEKNAYKIRDMAGSGFDIQSHGYYHHTYADGRQNEFNIRRSLEYLVKSGIRAEGFAAPKGIWNKALQAALERHGFLYSSEFALDYCGLPFYPAPEGCPSKVLQIPIYPVCWGLFRDAGIRADRAILDHMKAAVSFMHKNGMPAIIYGHPGESISDDTKILSELYEHSCSLAGMWRTTLSGFARWWNARNGLDFKRLDIDNENGVLSYELSDPAVPSGACLRILTANGRSAYCGLTGRSGRADLKGLAYEEAADSGADIFPCAERIWGAPYASRLKEYVAGLIDWEECTPISELQRNSLSSNIKYLLRRCGFDRIKINT